MGFFGAIFSGICSVASSVCSAVSSVCSAIGGALFSSVSSIATGIIGVAGLAPSIPALLITVSAIVSIVSKLAEALGLKEKEETPEELGMKAEMADKKPEDFDSVSAYINYIRKEVEIDKEKLENLSDEEKIKYSTIGAGLYIKGIEEQLGVEITPEFLKAMQEIDAKTDEVKAYIENFKANDIESMEDMVDYLKDDLDDSKDKSKISDAMISALREIHPNATTSELYDILNNMREL